ncbi:(4S)-4-hydroxy-5-phosphonooxypentane-2,3-dione isomerase [Pantoea osteomyelitidis]|uniref:(4S)-4-hydroxy-5-phosphonooxypentane-2,3-dione isomerase n=1 Tax=Pantoea osteomyelitidis TaxID=3230026 RepID=A0ABW7Q0Z2_9GAMM
MEVTLVEINVKADKIEEFKRVFLANHLGAINEPGNLRFDVLQDSLIPTRFYIYEAYTDNEAVMAHKKTAHYQNCVAALENLMSKPRKKTLFRALYP